MTLSAAFEMPRPLLFLFLLAACGTAAEPAERTDLGHDVQGQDTAGLRAYLAASGYTLDSLLRVRGDHAAVSARSHAAGGVHLVTLRRTDGRFMILGGDPLLEGVLPQRLGWIVLAEGDTMFTYSHDVPVEGLVSTIASVVRGDSLELVYYDRGTVCRASEFRDLDGDGRLELMAYSEPLSAGDCSSRCSLALGDRFPLALHWVTIHRWSASTWVPAEGGFPRFYRELAGVYDSAAAWIRGPDAADIGCEIGAVRWLTERHELLAQWARRADSLAGSSPQEP